MTVGTSRLQKNPYTAVALAILASAIIFVVATVILNNWPREWPLKAQINQSLEAAIQWHQANEKMLLSEQSPMLWWMLKEAAVETGDPRLQHLFAQFERQLWQDPRFEVWRPLFDQEYIFQRELTPARLADLLDYNRWFVFAVTCHGRLGATSEIQSFRSASYCPRFYGYLEDPACVTHQAIGALLLTERSCYDQETMRRLNDQLMERLHDQLTIDYRVIDTYIQRAWILTRSGRKDLLRATWVHRILQAQRPDGGWADAMELFPVSSTASLAFRGRGIGIVTPESNFHTSVQGLLLMALLSK